MNLSIPNVFFWALLALSAENMIFTGAVGFGRSLRVARKPALLPWTVLFLILFCMLSMVTAQALMPLTYSIPRPIVARAVIFLITDALLYLLVAWVIRRFFLNFWKKSGNAVSSGALNGLVLSMPFMKQIFALDILSSLGYAFGTGIAFAIGSLFLREALQRCSRREVPRAYKGLPATLIYTGLLCLAFYGFSGGSFL